MNWERRTIQGVGYDLSYSRAGEAYNPGMGYEQRDNFTWLNGRLLYGWIPGENSSLRAHQVLANSFLYLRNRDNSMESAEVGLGWDFEAKTGYEGRIMAKVYYEDILESFDISDDTNIEPGQYTFSGIESRFQTPAGRLFNIVLSLTAGSFYDGWRMTLGLTPRWNVSPNLEVSGYYQINKLMFEERDQELLAHVLRFRTSIMLSVKLSISAFLQYNSVSDAVISNIRLRYNPREGNDFYIVYDEGYNTDRYREIPVLPVRTNRAILLKYSHTFNR